ncbi:hypothetical protein JTE90_009597 [Oedothorax gibbosus]|uniref:Uncharacterized protein n=1 Tax=Oedothorax gibbosus TaxID=931172 RepID=A0AAV6VKG5_9ARAC|nr:hypothetical protein JTE90_009597 [Oedothorax gibbosus]
MNKGFPWILTLAVLSTGLIQTPCIELPKNRELKPQRNTFSPNPSRDENMRPLPVYRSYVRDTNRQPQSFQSTKSRYPNNARDTNGRSVVGYATMNREVYAHPLKPVTRSESLDYAPDRIVTRRPTSFIIPLRKSIRVNSPMDSLPPKAIQTAGYIKDNRMVKTPYYRTTHDQKHTVFDDGNTGQTPEQTEQDVTTSFDGRWTPKRLPTVQPLYKTTTYVRNLKPIPFTRYSDAMAAMEQKAPVGDKRGRPNPASSNSHPKGNTRSNLSRARGNSGSETKKNNPLNNKTKNKGQLDALVIQDSTKAPKIDNKLLEGYIVKNVPVTINQNKDNFKDVIQKTTGAVTIGVEYADPEHEINNSKSFDNSKTIDDFLRVNRNENLQSYPNKASEQPGSTNFEFQDRYPEKRKGLKDGDTEIANISVDNSKIIDDSHEYVLNSKNLFNHKESKKQNSQRLKEVETPNKFKDEGEFKFGSFVRYDDSTSEAKSSEDTKHESPDEAHNPNSDKNNKFFEFNELDAPNSKNSIVRSDNSSREVHSAVPLTDYLSPKTPFYVEVVHDPSTNQDYSKDIPKDQIYFPQIFPDSNIGIQNHRNDTTTKHTSVSITQNKYTDRERLIEINPKVPRDQNIHFNQPKAETISSNSNPPTSPTFSVPPDHKDSKNKTSNYVLHRNPVLSKERPGHSYPRRPTIRLTPGMLAGILVAALIFLGFLTGTMTFLFHQFRFGSPPKKAERHNKRTTVYAPEYMDETFSGNTYIHNNIFLPNTQNLEDRLSPDLDTSFSVDSQETAQVNDYASSSANTRVKTTLQQKIHDED